MRRLGSSVLVLAGLVGAGCERETANQPPVARAGDDEIAFRGDSISLDGSGSFDPDDPDGEEPLAFAWRLISGPASVADSATASLDFVATAAGSYVFELAVTDSDDGVSTDIVVVEAGNVLGVTAIVPGDGASGIAARQPVVVFFDAPIRPWTAAASVRVDDVTDPVNPDPVEGNVTLEDDGTAVVFSPVVDWSDLAEYRVTVTTAVMGLDGAPLRAEETASFLGAALDTVPPSIVSASPGPDGATGIARASYVEVVFSEPVDEASLAAAFALADGVGPIDGVLTLGAGGTRLFFVPADTTQATPIPSPLAASTTYALGVLDTMLDENGNALAADFTQSFQTTAATDTAPPVVLSVSPLRGAQGVSVKLPVVITFDEPVAPGSLAASLTLTSSGVSSFAPLDPVMTRGNTVAVFTPPANLKTGTVYQLSLAGAADLFGNAITGSFDSYFTTGDAPPPTVVQVLPDRGPIDSTLVVQVQGEDFVDGANVFVPGGGVLVNQTTFLSETLLQAELTISPNAQLGTRPVTVTNPDGQAATGLSLFDILRLPPSIASLSPGAANLGQSNVAISLLGASFQNGATVSISGADVSVDALTFANDGQLDITVSVAGGAATGPRNVTVTNPDGQSVTLTNGFLVRLPAPTVTGMVPGSGGQGENLFSVVINGSNFQSAPFPAVDLGAGVLASTIAATTTSATVNISIAGTAPLGAHDVTLTNADGQSVTLDDGFSVVFAPPTVIGSSPSAPQAATTNVTVNGTNFQCSGPNGGPTLEVLQGGLASAGVTVDNAIGGLTGCNATSFTRGVTVTGGAAVGLHDLRVRNPDNQFRDGANTFRILEERPVVAQVQDSTGAALTQVSRKASHANAKVIGSFFQNGATISMGAGISITSLSFISATELQVSFNVLASSALGAVNVIVTNPDTLQGSNSGVLSVREAAPSVGALSVALINQGETAPGVTLAGDDFQCGTNPGVAFSGANVTAAVTACSTTSLTLTVSATAAAALGGRTVTVTNADLQAGLSSGNVLTVREQAPVISGLTVNSGRQELVVSTRINGSFFRAGAQVSFGSGVAVTIDAIDPGQTFIDVTLSIGDAAPTGAHTVTVVHPDDGQSDAFSPFTVQLALPDVTAVSPTPRNQGESFALTVTGGDFDCSGNGPTIEVLFAGVPDAGVTEDNSGAAGACTASSFTRPIAIGAGATVGAHSVRVTNPDTGTGTGGTLQIREQAPVISGLTVNSGRQEQTVGTRINGSFFRAGAQVSFGAGIAVTVDAIDPGESFIDVTLTIADAAAAGSRTVTVTHPDDGQLATFSPFTVQLALPDVVSVSPTPKNQGESFTLTVNGGDFDCTGNGPTIEVLFGGVPDAGVVEDNSGAAGSCTANSFTRPVTIGAGATVGAHSVRVTNPDSGTGTGGTLDIREQAPVITSLTVASGRQEATVSTRINGSFFRAGAQVSFGAGVAVTVDVIDPGQSFIDVTLTIADAAPTGAHTVTVTHPDDGQLATFSPFTVQLALPDVVSVSPTPKNQGEAFTLTVNGGDFDCSGNGPAIELLFGGVPDAGIVEDNSGAAGSCSANSFTRPVTIGAGATVGAHAVRVTNPDGGTGTGGTLVVREQQPAITSLTVSTGRQEQTLSTRIDGSFFRAGAQVSFGAGIAVTVDAIDPGETFIDVTLTIADAAPTGAHTVTVTHPDDGQLATFSPFTVELALPDVVSVSPTPRNQGESFTLTVNGGDFDCSGNGPTIEVLVGGVPDAGVVVDNSGAAGACSASSFTRPIAIGATAIVGAHSIRVTNPDGGTGTGATLGIREQQPAITSLTVSTGRQEQTLSTRINGTFLRAGAQVSFGAGVSVTVDAIDPGETFIDVTLTIADAAPAGAHTVTVTHPDDGQLATFSPFTVQLALPDVVSVSPTPKNQEESFTLTVNGGDFDCSGNGPTIDVLFGGVPDAGVVEDNSGAAGSCTANSFTRPVSIGAGAIVGAHTVRVTNPDTGEGTGGTLQIREQAPTITALTVTSGRQEQTVSTRVSGTFLRAGAQVSFGAGIAVTVDAIDPGESFIDVTLTLADNAALGARTATVTHPDDGQLATGGTFTVLTASPDVVSVSPSPVNQGAQNVSFTVSGDDFDCRGVPPAVVLGSGMSVDSVTCPGTDVSENSLTVVADVGTGAEVLGPHAVTVTNPEAPPASGTLLGAFVVREQAPILTELRTSDGLAVVSQVSQKSTYSNLRLIGDFFLAGATVSMGSDVQIAAINRIDEQRIDVTFTVLASAPIGALTITVNNPDGQSVNDSSIVSVRQPEPRITGVTPAEGNRGSVYAGASAIDVTGTDFDCSGLGPAVDFGADVTESVFSCSATLIEVDVDLAGSSLGLHNVTVTNPDLQSHTQTGFFEVLAEKPVVSAVVTTPPSGPPGQGRRAETLTVDVTGNFFQATPAVSFGGGIAVTGVTFVSANTLEVDIVIAPGAALGNRNVTVNNPDTQSGAGNDTFEVLRGVPTITSMVRVDDLTSAGSQLEPAFDVTVTGDHFDCTGVPDVELGGGVTVNGETCTGGSTNRETTLTATVTIGGGSVGPHNVTVQNAGDTVIGTGVNLFTVREEKPIVSSVSSPIKQGEQLLVSVLGTPNGFFQPGAVVTIPGGQASVVGATGFVTANELTVTLDVPYTTAAGTYPLRVTNPDGQVDEESVLEIAEADAPGITGVCNDGGVPCDPAWADQGGTRRIVISGNGFQPAFTLAIGGAVPFSLVSANSTAITIDVSPELAQALTLRDITVTNTSSSPNKNTGATGNGKLQITQAAPTVSTVTPANTAQGSTAVGVVIAGTNFRTGATVTFSGSGVSAVVTNVDELLDEITCDITAAPSALATARDVTVVNSDGSRGTKTGGFTVDPAPGAPTITSVERDPTLAGAPAVASMNDDKFSIRQGETAQFHVLGSNFDDTASVIVTGPGVTVSGTTVFPGGGRIDFNLAVDCSDLAPGKRDVIVINPGAPDGNGLNGAKVAAIHIRRGVVINELATDDFTAHGFGGTGEVVEIFNGSQCAWDVTNYRLEGVDGGGGFVYELLGTAGRELYSAGSTVASLAAGGYALVRRPDGNADNMGDDIQLNLFSRSGRYLDHIELGDDEENDGAGDGAPDGTADGGNAGGAGDEMVARCPNGSVTDDLDGADNDVNDFFQSEAVGFAQAATDRASNNTQCPPCADGLDNDGDGWVDMLDPGCTNPHTDISEGLGAEGTTQCNDNVDNDGVGGTDENDPDCFSGFDTDEAN